MTQDALQVAHFVISTFWTFFTTTLIPGTTIPFSAWYFLSLMILVFVWWFKRNFLDSGGGGNAK